MEASKLSILLMDDAESLLAPARAPPCHHYLQSTYATQCILLCPYGNILRSDEPRPRSRLVITLFGFSECTARLSPPTAGITPIVLHI